MNKLICFDLDGTLLNSQKQVSDTNIKALRYCCENNDFVYFVTGRPTCFARFLADKIDKRIKTICFNGAFYEQDGKQIEFKIDDLSIKNVINEISNFKQTKIFLKSKNAIYTNSDYDARFLYDELNEYLSEDMQIKSHINLSYDEIYKTRDNILKIIVFDENSDNIKQIRCILNKYNKLNITSCYENGFDIVSQNVNKKIALQSIIKSLNIDINQVYAFGDGDNDIEMLSYAGTSFAMMNAGINVKNIADFVIPSNDDNGVSWAIKNIIYKDTY